jgi:hypothetical protein
MRPKARIHKSCISSTWIRIDQGFLMTYYMYYYVKYVESYKAFFTGYWKTVFTQVLQMRHKPRIQKSHKCGTIIDVDQSFPMSYYMCCLIDYMLCYSIFFPGYLYSSVKPWIQKYCKRGWNRRCTSAVYAASRMILIRAFQQDSICGIVLAISKVMACSFKGSDINCNSRCYSIGWHMSQTVTP